jgi:hypothetical protein
MKKDSLADDDEMPAEFDFSRAIPNPWFVKVHGADYVRVIEKDLAAMFPDNESMNAALWAVAEPMKNNPIDDDDPLDQEIEFNNPQPNPFARAYGRNRNLRVLSPDLLAVFPNSDAVDEALRAYIRLTSAVARDRDDDPLDVEIDFSKSRPNPYWLGVVDRSRVRVLDSDVAEAFCDDAAVNEALRMLLEKGDRKTKKP